MLFKHTRPPSPRHAAAAAQHSCRRHAGEREMGADVKLASTAGDVPGSAAGCMGKLLRRLHAPPPPPAPQRAQGSLARADGGGCTPEDHRPRRFVCAERAAGEPLATGAAALSAGRGAAAAATAPGTRSARPLLHGAPPPLPALLALLLHLLPLVLHLHVPVPDHCRGAALQPCLWRPLAMPTLPPSAAGVRATL